MREKLHEIIFEADTKVGRLFDIILLIVILVSVLMVVLVSVESIEARWGYHVTIAEYIITGIFTIEYGLRIYTVKKARSYIFSYYGIVDLLAILPTFLELVLAGTHLLVVIRVLRLIRVFRIFKLTRYTSASTLLARALWASRAKISVFLTAIFTLTIVIGTLMYLIEGPQNGFRSIPESIYWSIVTMTTVGYGDISPATPFGKFVAGIVMIIGYAVLAVPTGIVSVELSKLSNAKNTQVCPNCLTEQHEDGAKYCHECGQKLNRNDNMIE
ncbi:ion transporter [Puteibacter caeruleilacunae]|nr:ion transporter [Puteibacter caeruleilacunae]